MGHNNCKKDEKNALACVQQFKLVNYYELVNQRLFTIPHIAHGGAKQCTSVQLAYALIERLLSSIESPVCAVCSQCAHCAHTVAMYFG